MTEQEAKEQKDQIEGEEHIAHAFKASDNMEEKQSSHNLYLLPTEIEMWSL